VHGVITLQAFLRRGGGVHERISARCGLLQAPTRLIA
jgi:hypothetical protein